MFQLRVYKLFITAKNVFAASDSWPSSEFLPLRWGHGFRFIVVQVLKSSKVKSAKSTAVYSFSEDILFIKEIAFSFRGKIFNNIFLVIKLMRIDFKTNLFIVTKFLPLQKLPNISKWGRAMFRNPWQRVFVLNRMKAKPL